MNNVWEKDYFGYMRGSKFIAVLFGWKLGITKLGIAMNCSYREGDILSMLVGFFNGIADNDIDGRAELMEYRGFRRCIISFSVFFH